MQQVVKILKELEKKYLRGKNAVEKEEQKDIDMPRNNILFRRLPNPRHEQLPIGRVFFSKYKRVNRHAPAPTQVRILRKYVQKIGPRKKRIRRFCPRNKRKRRQQAGAGPGIATAIDLGKRAAGSKLGKMMINDAIDYIPTAYKKKLKIK